MYLAVNSLHINMNRIKLVFTSEIIWYFFTQAKKGFLGNFWTGKFLKGFKWRLFVRNNSMHFVTSTSNKMTSLIVWLGIAPVCNWRLSKGTLNRLSLIADFFRFHYLKYNSKTFSMCKIYFTHSYTQSTRWKSQIKQKVRLCFLYFTLSFNIKKLYFIW